MNRFGPAPSAELGHQRGDVELDRVLADAKPARDGLVGETFRHKLEHLALPQCELICAVRAGGASGAFGWRFFKSGGGQQVPGGHRIKHQQSLPDGAHGGDDGLAPGIPG